MADSAGAEALRLVVVSADPALGDSLAVGIDAARQRHCRTVPEALEALRREPFDAVLAVHDRPAIDAPLLARALRGAGDETPLVVIVEGLTGAIADQSLRCGADRCVGPHPSRVAEAVADAVSDRESLRRERLALVNAQARGRSELGRFEGLVAGQHGLVETLSAVVPLAAPVADAYPAAGSPADANPPVRRAA